MVRTSAIPIFASALMFATWAAPLTQASPISPKIGYITSGNVDGTNDGPVKFFNTDPYFTPPSSILLGRFQTSPLPSGSSLTYNGTPFTIDIHFFDDKGKTTSEIEVKGQLNGTLSGNQSSTMYATFTSIQQVGPGTLPFPIDTFTMPGRPLLIRPNGVGRGVTHIDAHVSWDPSKPQPVPEPTVLAIFGMLAAGAGLKHWRHRTFV